LPVPTPRDRIRRGARASAGATVGDVGARVDTDTVAVGGGTGATASPGSVADAARAWPSGRLVLTHRLARHAPRDLTLAACGQVGVVGDERAHPVQAGRPNTAALRRRRTQSVVRRVRAGPVAAGHRLTDSPGRAVVHVLAAPGRWWRRRCAAHALTRRRVQ